MGLVRILVDGYSLLHAWPELCRGNAPHSAAARHELVRILTSYQDTAGTPITIFFDGSRPKLGMRDATPCPVEVLYSSAGQTADQMIERAAYRFRPYGEVLAVTNDLAERETVLSLGGFAASCRNFIDTVQTALVELQDDLKMRNRQEQHAFKRRKK